MPRWGQKTVGGYLPGVRVQGQTSKPTIREPCKVCFLALVLSFPGLIYKARYQLDSLVLVVFRIRRFHWCWCFCVI